ncbi:IS110 family transposase [Lapillicoccus jejuensis]|uniref:Transposase n=1 Tax=Lapillicoccus jejuensis TaxID=402171 RepID=A0A542E2F8_9MICO|nr:IS110 family transposase [Lapillicoccus jejuensis]TQJ08287.1 transposase [Lapillicoccus jejuensis]TQJ09505.1 transposase [Lapillicoccus jejuensis]
MTTIARGTTTNHRRDQQADPDPQLDQQREPGQVVGGVDTHLDTHTAAALDPVGRLLGHATFPADPGGYAALLAWLRSFGTVVVVGVEGTGAYGAGLTRHLRAEQVQLLEIDRPDRRARRSAGKSDPLDAEAAALAALARTRTGVPKVRDGRVEALRNLRVARRSAIDQRADCQRRIKTLIVTAAEPLRARLRGLPTRQLLAACAGLRPDLTRVGDPEQATKTALRALARRHHALSEEITDLDAVIDPLVAAINPQLVALNGVGADVAGQLLVTAGENSDRVHSEAAFAMLCGVAPIPASSGRTHRHRLNRGGDRQANAALYRVVLCRLRWDPRTQAYMHRRTEQGLSKKDIIRCLKRLIAREIYYVLNPRLQPSPALQTI